MSTDEELLAIWREVQYGSEPVEFLSATIAFDGLVHVHGTNGFFAVMSQAAWKTIQEMRETIESEEEDGKP